MEITIFSILCGSIGFLASIIFLSITKPRIVYKKSEEKREISYLQIILVSLLFAISTAIITFLWKIGTRNIETMQPAQAVVKQDPQPTY